MKNDLRKEIALEKGVTAFISSNVLTVKGPKGEVKREFVHPRISMTVEDNKIILQSPQGTKREKTLVCSFQSHIKNMVKGVQELYVYKLRVCSGHFPISAIVSGEDFIIKNFLGETISRKAKIIKGAQVKITGAEIVISSPDVEVAGQMAARIEQLCRITNRDLRVFQDGCYIIEKAN